MPVASPKSSLTHRAQPVGWQNEDTPRSVEHASMDESDMILQRRLSTAPIIPGSPSTPTRSTFPFKPAASAVTPQGNRSECIFRPRPVVPLLTPPSRSHKVYNPPKRCKTFPNIDDPHPPPQAIKIEAPAWLTGFTKNVKKRSAPATSLSVDVSDGIPIIFPVPVHNDTVRQDKEVCWWLDDVANWQPFREKPQTTVRNFLIELRKETMGNKASTHSVVYDEDKSNELDDALRDLLKLHKMPHVSPEISSMQQQVHELKRYLMSAHHLHEDKREMMHVVLQKIESVVIETVKDERCEQRNTTLIEDYYRKTKVGLTGGSLVTAGLILIPTPVIPGILVVYGGLLVLASEFDSAKTAVESIKVPMKELLKDEKGPNKGIYDCFHMIMWEEMIGYDTDKKELDEDFMAIMRMKPWKDNVQNDGASDDAEKEKVRREKKNVMKRYARQLLLLEDSTTDSQKKQDENTDQGNDKDKVKSQEWMIRQTECTKTTNQLPAKNGHD